MYDVAVVGAGMAGQVCANYLAKFGKKTILLEQNHHAGGNMSGFTRKGFYFDGGDQSFESLGVVFPILQDLGVYDTQEWIKARYRMVSDDFDFFIDSIDQVEDELRTAFPNEPGIAPLFAGVKEVSRFLSEFYDPWTFPVLNDFRVGRLGGGIKWLARLRKWTQFAYREQECARIQDPALRRWFTSVGYYKMPYLFFAGFWHIWANDYWYPAGGMQALHDKLTDAFTARGGEVRFNALATRIRHDGRQATGIELASGEIIRAKTIVYSGDYKRLLTTVLGPELFRPSFVTKVTGARLTEEILTVYLGLDMSDEQVAAQLRAHHPFYFPNYDVIFPDTASPRDVHAKMWVALNHFGSDPRHSSAPEGKSTVTLQTYSSFSWEDFWHNGSGENRRTTDYRAFKQEIAMDLVGLAERLMPNLREHIAYMDVGTPLSLKRFTLNTDGSTGGWCYHDKVSPVFRLPTLNLFKTPLPNLYANGHYALWPGGVISAALSGRLVANMVSGRRALAPIGSL